MLLIFGRSFFQMMNTHVENAVNVVIVERIEHGLSAAARLDQLGLLQNAKLVGNGGLRQIKKARDITNAKLRLSERIKNADPRGISEHLEKFRKVKKNFFLGHFSQNVLHHVLVYAEKFAFFKISFVVHSLLLFQNI